ncbi:hypothetical protein E3V39_03775 [Gammaproteobacteria bacterium LSUCC0112]|nr:hypothetical protein E3V39_03775 [Gammaproteobacteria bacterium LSUCC0112]
MKLRELLLVVLIACCMPFVFASEGPGTGAGLFVVFSDNASNRTPDAAMLKRMLLGQLFEWPDGNRVRLALPSSKSPAYNVAGSRIFGGNGRTMTRLWLQKVFSGESRAPAFLDTDADVLDEVMRNPNTLGVLGSMPDELPSGVRVMEL